jgi:hypothetical protein
MSSIPQRQTISRVMYWLLLLAPNIGLAMLVAEIWLRYPDNHGAGPVFYRWLFAGALLASLGFRWLASMVHWPSLMLALFGLLLTWIVDARNIMVNYDEWIKRRMPDWGESTRLDSSTEEEETPK